MNSLMQYALIPLAAVTSFWQGRTTSNVNLMACNTLNYTTEIVSLDPMAIYINGLLSGTEADYLLNLAKSQDAFVHHEDKYPEHMTETSRRIASSCHLPQEDPVVQCFLQRALNFVGFIEHDGFESLQVVKYLPGERHDPHQDWFAQPPQIAPGLTCNRAASFFVYLGDEPTGGETCFHHLNPAPLDADPTKFSNINSDDGLGIAVKPIIGNAMFWMNLHSNNTGDDRVRHSALPVKSGVKYGMNVLLKRCFSQ
ncbi:putative prolyl 4-hydroxylase alpha subunit [Aspergillus bertholletiae]|uniref:Putative prolyl 4-hydroxylase alpha subunit n=1 Tax=Aspergillus bertholletiae TaxID=1226010 RepID=A0A5N7AXX4_9EURO|nr:putative prolyl 4-hydroxylase alpha subunit [Aspergillus bertholletiae]